jgi:nucleotide-binding universal stress UspA family protein
VGGWSVVFEWVAGRWCSSGWLVGGVRVGGWWVLGETPLGWPAVGGCMRVLLGVAGGEESRRALEETVERAVVAGDALTVAVIEKEDSERSQDAVAADVRAYLAERDVDADVRVVSGDPGSSLVDLAEREGFDELAIGGGTQSPMGKIRLGSVTEFVLLNATTSVRLVR